MKRLNIRVFHIFFYRERKDVKADEANPWFPRQFHARSSFYFTMRQKHEYNHPNESSETAPHFAIRPRFVDARRLCIIENCVGLFSRGWMLFSQRTRKEIGTRATKYFTAQLYLISVKSEKEERRDIWRREKSPKRDILPSVRRKKKDKRKRKTCRGMCVTRGHTRADHQEERQVSLVEIGTSSPRFETAARNGLTSITRVRFLSERSTGACVATVVDPTMNRRRSLPPRASTRPARRMHRVSPIELRYDESFNVASSRRAAIERNHSVAIFPRVESERKLRRRRDSSRFFFPSFSGARGLTWVLSIFFFHNLNPSSTFVIQWRSCLIQLYRSPFFLASDMNGVYEFNADTCHC